MSGFGCQCGGGGECGCSDGLHGYMRMLGPPSPQYGQFGAIDAATAAAQVIGSNKNINAGSKSAIAASAGAGQMLDAGGQPAYIPGSGDCSAVNGQNMLKPALLTTGGGLALKFAGATGPAAPFVMAIGGIMEVFGAIFAHHAAAVKKEQSTLCAAVPAANHTLQVIDEAVQSGSASPQDAINALQALPGQFQGEVGGIYKDCNAACVMADELKAICLVKASEYQDLIIGAAQQVVPARPNVTSPAGSTVPASSYSSFYGQPAARVAPSSSESWLPIAAIAIGAIFLMRGL